MRFAVREKEIKTEREREDERARERERWAEKENERWHGSWGDKAFLAGGQDGSEIHLLLGNGPLHWSDKKSLERRCRSVWEGRIDARALLQANAPSLTPPPEL